MLMNNLLPDVEPNKVKDRVIATLASKYPLTIKALKNQIRRQYNTNISYHAIYKVLRDLSRKNIIRKVNKTFMLNIEWIKKINQFSEQLLENYSKSKKYSINILRQLKKDGDVLTLDFNSLMELDEFFIKVMEHYSAFLSDNERIIMHYRHNWYPLLYSKKEHEMGVNSNKFYCLCGSNTYLDKWCCDFENKIGLHIKYKKDIAQNWDLHLYKDLIIQFHIDPTIMAALDKFFEISKSIKDICLRKLIDILNKKGRINVIITKNRHVAEQIREATLKNFRIK